MTIRDLLHNAVSAHLVGNLACAPLADRATRAFGRFAGQFENLAGLLVGHAHRFARARRISRPVHDGEVVPVDRLRSEPALAPEASDIKADVEGRCNSGVVEAISNCQNDPRP